MTDKEKILTLKRVIKLRNADRKLLKQACKNLNNLLTTLDTYWELKRKGHSPSTVDLEISFSKAEEFLDNMDWESL